MVCMFSLVLSGYKDTTSNSILVKEKANICVAVTIWILDASFLKITRKVWSDSGAPPEVRRAVPVRKSRARLLPGKGGSLLFVATPVSVAHGKRGFYWLRPKFPPTILALKRKSIVKVSRYSRMVTWKDDDKRYI